MNAKIHVGMWPIEHAKVFGVKGLVVLPTGHKQVSETDKQHVKKYIEQFGEPFESNERYSLYECSEKRAFGIRFMLVWHGEGLPIEESLEKMGRLHIRSFAFYSLIREELPSFRRIGSRCDMGFKDIYWLVNLDFSVSPEWPEEADKEFGCIGPLPFRSWYLMTKSGNVEVVACDLYTDNPSDYTQYPRNMMMLPHSTFCCHLPDGIAVTAIRPSVFTRLFDDGLAWREYIENIAIPFEVGAEARAQFFKDLPNLKEITVYPA